MFREWNWENWRELWVIEGILKTNLFEKSNLNILYWPQRFSSVKGAQMARFGSNFCVNSSYWLFCYYQSLLLNLFWFFFHWYCPKCKNYCKISRKSIKTSKQIQLSHQTLIQIICFNQNLQEPSPEETHYQLSIISISFFHNISLHHHPSLFR